MYRDWLFYVLDLIAATLTRDKKGEKISKGVRKKGHDGQNRGQKEGKCP